MKSYGQFCPLALASEIVGERWTPLVLRELVVGKTRFNDIQRGVPNMSPPLLTKRLRKLEDAGILERHREGRHITYRLTEAGQELAPVIESLAIWGHVWLPAALNDGSGDTDQVFWDIPRRMRLEDLPATARTVIEFEITDAPQDQKHRWIVATRSGAELCLVDPGFDVDLLVTTSCQDLLWIWSGDVPLTRAISEGRLTVDGPQELRAAFPEWLMLSVFAEIPRKHPLNAG